jgi:hypothetical protein
MRIKAMENNDEVTGVEPMRSAFSRRTALKGAGVGVAVWAAPTVLSMGSAAHAASNAPPLACNGCDPNGDPCSNQTACGDPSEGCSCKTVAAGGSCLCTANGYCEDFQECPNGQSDCPTGLSCVSSCCNDAGYPNLCLPNCGAGAAIKHHKVSSKSAGGPRTNHL